MIAVQLRKSFLTLSLPPNFQRADLFFLSCVSSVGNNLKFTEMIDSLSKISLYTGRWKNLQPWFGLGILVCVEIYCVLGGGKDIGFKFIFSVTGSCSADSNRELSSLPAMEIVQYEHWSFVMLPSEQLHLGQMEDQKSSNDKEVIDLLIASTVPIALQYLANKIAGTVPAARKQKAAVKG